MVVNDMDIVYTPLVVHVFPRFLSKFRLYEVTKSSMVLHCRDMVLRSSASSVSQMFLSFL